MSVAMNIHVDDTQLRAALKEASTEIPRALRNSLNDTLRDVQKAERENITSVFHVRQKSYISGSVKIPKEGGFATKDIARGEIGIDPQRDVLAKHESGGDFPSYSGKPRQPIPAREIRTGRGGTVKPGTALKNFLPFSMAAPINAMRLAGSKMGHLSGRRTQFARDTRERLVGQKGSFFIATKQGDPMLVRKVKGGAMQRLYIWYEEKRIKPRLAFHRVAAAVIPAAWEKNMAAAFVHAMRRFNSK